MKPLSVVLNSEPITVVSEDPDFKQIIIDILDEWADLPTHLQRHEQEAIVKRIAQHLANHPEEQELAFLQDELPQNRLILFVGALAHNQTLLTLTIQDNCYGEPGISALAMSLMKNTILQNLNLIRIEDEILDADEPSPYSAFLDALGAGANFTLRCLKLEESSLLPRDAILLSYVLCYNRGLEELNLSNNSIRDEGARALAEGVRRNNRIRILNLSDNEIESIDSLAAVLKSHPSLEELDLSMNVLSIEAGCQLAGCLTFNAHLKRLDLCDTFSSKVYNADPAAIALATALLKNRCLEQLRFKSNMISDAGIEALHSAAKSNVSLKVLEIDDIDMTDGVDTPPVLQSQAQSAFFRMRSEAEIQEAAKDFAFEREFKKAKKSLM